LEVICYVGELIHLFVGTDVIVLVVDIEYS
jgi:hypothetical protein